QAYRVQPPVCAPIQRLAKWDGADWVPVMPGDLSSGNIHVLVHGWGPGLRTFANDGGKIWDATDPTTGSNTNEDFAGLLRNAAMVINAVAPGDTVVAFNWLDMSATERSPSDIISFTEAWQSRAKTDEAAAGLISALKSACDFSGSYNGKLQIMGISHGARVASLTTEQLFNKGGAGSVIVNHLTLADSPEGIAGLANASNNLSPVLEGIKIGRDASATFVDNYYSYFGSSYTVDNNVVNVKLNPDQYLPIEDKHSYPIPWYGGASVLAENLGLAWSPLEGDLYKTLGSSYEQDWQNPDGTLDWSREYVLKEMGAGPSSSVESRTALSLSTLLTQGAVTGILGGMLLTEHSPAYWHTGFTKNLGDVAIEFTYHFVSPGDGDQLGLWIDDQLQFIITGELAGTEVRISDIDISNLSAGDHILSVALYNFGDVNASVEVSDFTMISTPEPSSLFLLAAGIIFVRKRK
ncbi:MAG: PEP-CTERM sorting domain-containing protein, partial [Candidatus Parcubacteria bacterium]|nr:PEP-CTERM sorting domain-containing protein [Candidatus Parcubacteria bacterium]